MALSQRRGDIAAFLREHRTALIVLGVGLLLLALVIAKTYLIVRLLIGNDVLLDATGGNATISAEPGASVPLPLAVSVTTNPFCAARCSAVLRDVGTGGAVDTLEFTVRAGIPQRVERAVTVPDRGEGQLIYRWEVQCAARQTMLCQTRGAPVTRDAISIITYGPGAQDRERRDALRADLVALADTAAWHGALLDAIWTDLLALNATLAVDDAPAEAQDLSALLQEDDAAFQRAEVAWAAEDYATIAAIFEEAHAREAAVAGRLPALRASADGLLAAHRSDAERLEAIRETLRRIAVEPVANATLLALANGTIARYTMVRLLIAESRATVASRETALDALEADATGLETEDDLDRRVDAIGRRARATVVLDALCAQGIACVQHPTIMEIAAENAPDRAAACEEAQDALIALMALNVTPAGPQNETLLTRASRIAEDAIRNATLQGLATLSDEAPNTALLTDLLTPVPQASGEPDDPALRPLVGLALVNAIPAYCPAPGLPIPPTVGIDPITPALAANASGGIALPDPVPQCCALGSCGTCCDNDACRGGIPPPVIFLHGHAFNRDTSAAYSLDAFDRIQELLESDGYLGMGTLDLSQSDIPAGSWSRAGAPITVKASYYYDVYASPDNALLVQTKTENIDTYAIRLRDIIDETRRRAGRERVTIIAHSMGGLVTRRYLQIFGEGSVARVIMIGTPNHGIAGSVADYCTLLGEDLECRDMKEESLFLNKLERASIPGIPVSVIIGTGCDTDGEDGDGVVTATNAALSWATNRYLNGTCDGLTTLHTTMLDTDRYPETYAILREDLVTVSPAVS